MQKNVARKLHVPNSCQIPKLTRKGRNYQDRVLKRRTSWKDSLYPRQGILSGGQTPGPVGSTESPGQEAQVSQQIFDKREGKADTVRAARRREPPATLTVLGRLPQNES